jgi:hypothetical protein
MRKSDFFKESTEQSRIKADIVSKYFFAWASVVIPTTKKRSNRIAYVDLFAGPGRYDDGNRSTPLRILAQGDCVEGEGQAFILPYLSRFKCANGHWGSL